MDNSVIVGHICKFMDVATLKIVRQVNQLWKAAGAKQLLLKTFIQIPPGFYPHRHHKILQFIIDHLLQEQQQQQIDNNKATLFDLITLLHPRIQFEGGEFQWLHRRGRNIRICRFEDIATLHKVRLLNRDVKHLQFSRNLFPANKNSDIMGIADQEAATMATLATLKHLLTRHLTSLESLVFFDVGENNKGPHFNRIEDLGLFIKLNKIHLVKSLALQPADLYTNLRHRQLVNYNDLTTAISNLEEFSESICSSTNKSFIFKAKVKVNSPPKSQLQSILLGHGNKRLAQDKPVIFSRYIRCVNKILQSSKETVETLDIFDTLSDLPNFHIPVLSRLTTLNAAVVPGTKCRVNINNNVNRKNSNYDPIFPPGNPDLTTSNLFPRLQCLRVGVVQKSSKLQRRPISTAPSPGQLISLLPMLRDDFSKFSKSNNNNDDYFSLSVFWLWLAILDYFEILFSNRHHRFLVCRRKKGFFVTSQSEKEEEGEEALRKRINKKNSGYSYQLEEPDEARLQFLYNVLFVLAHLFVFSLLKFLFVDLAT